IEGMKLMGTFCYQAQAVFPIYFVMRVSEMPESTGYWKKQPEMPVKAQWDHTAGIRKIYTDYHGEIAGDDIGAFFSFDFETSTTVDVQIGISYVSVANARKNLNAEQNGFHFDRVHQKAQEKWEEELGHIRVKGGTPDEKTVFYTALYHALIHPNILQDINGEYPAM